MLRDAELSCTPSPQAVAGTGALVTTDSVDTGAAKDQGSGETLIPFCRVTTAFAGGTSVIAECIGADDVALTSNVVVLSSGPSIALANLGANAMIPVPPPAAGVARKRYMGGRLQRTGTFTSGNFTYEFVRDKQTAQI